MQFLIRSLQNCPQSVQTLCNPLKGQRSSSLIAGSQRRAEDFFSSILVSLLTCSCFVFIGRGTSAPCLVCGGVCLRLIYAASLWAPLRGGIVRTRRGDSTHKSPSGPRRAPVGLPHDSVQVPPVPAGVASQSREKNNKKKSPNWLFSFYVSPRRRL